MKRSLCAAGLALFLAAMPARAQSAAAPRNSAAAQEQGPLLKSAEAFIRNLFAWGPDFKLKLGPLGPSASPEFYSLPVEVTFNGRSDKGTFYVSKDGKVFLRGDLYQTSADPFAENEAKLRAADHPAEEPVKGPADARVTLTEFSDFECPHCRELYETMKTVEVEFPQVRVVYKNFPLVQIHPWAETAAIGARCAFQQSPASFWKVHDAIFDSQDLISPENVWDKLVGFATAAGLNADSFKACMAAPASKNAVDANRAEGVALEVNSTPTVFVNGRPLVGGDKTTLEQNIKFELAK
ncbi:MAG TPA: thioredoxin domain-containing protein [Candidatus Acidoferrales bacterium]|nr:thioredoxin domain-containing protein [Candidatus Acidoferrales bacterium]